MHRREDFAKIDRELLFSGGLEAESRSADETIALGRRIGELADSGDVIELVGGLGAGKTHLVKGIAVGLGISSEVTSPTFNLLCEYRFGRLPLFHFDLYRLDSAEQLDDIGYFEILGGEGLGVVEWADKFEQAHVDGALRVEISCAEGSLRVFRALSVCLREE